MMRNSRKHSSEAFAKTKKASSLTDEYFQHDKNGLVNAGRKSNYPMTYDFIKPVGHIPD